MVSKNGRIWNICAVDIGDFVVVIVLRKCLGLTSRSRIWEG